MPSEPIEYFISYYKSGKLYSRRSIGELTDKGIEFLKEDLTEKINFDNIIDFDLQGKNKLDSSPEGKHAHQAAIKRFSSGCRTLLSYSEQYREQLDGFIQEIKSNNCLSIDFDGWFGACNHPALKERFPVPLNLAIDQYALRVPAFRYLPVPFQRFFRRVRHIIVMCELVQYAKIIPSLLSIADVLPSEDLDPLQNQKSIDSSKSTDNQRPKKTRRSKKERQRALDRAILKYWYHYATGQQKTRSEIESGDKIGKSALSGTYALPLMEEMEKMIHGTAKGYREHLLKSGNVDIEGIESAIQKQLEKYLNDAKKYIRLQSKQKPK